MPPDPPMKVCYMSISHRTTTVTLAAHARRGLIIIIPNESMSAKYGGMRLVIDKCMDTAPTPGAHGSLAIRDWEVTHA